MEIVKYPHPALRRVARPIERVTDQVRRLAEEMLRLMHEAPGVGLAANQVGVPVQLFVVADAADPFGENKDRVFINPEILDRSGQCTREEGCLSFPGIYAEIVRPERIRVRAMDLSGEIFEVECADLPARVIQHEWDHLRGILFIDRMLPLQKRKLLPQLRQLEREYRALQREGVIPPDAQLREALAQVEAAYS